MDDSTICRSETWEDDMICVGWVSGAHPFLRRAILCPYVSFLFIIIAHLEWMGGFGLSEALVRAPKLR